jgi:hypothetical protein
MRRLILTLAYASVLLIALAGTRVAAQGETAPGAKSETTTKPGEGEGAKPESGEAAKPAEAQPSAASPAPETKPAESESGPVSLAELTREGFEIRATNFIPAEAVTRQSGKVTSDAFIVTLQKTSSTAVCFYTLKAYVGKKLTTIPACTVHR